MRRIVLIILVILIIGAGVFLFLQKKESSPENSNTNNTNGTSIPVYGNGEVLITLKVKVPEWTPAQDKIYVYIDDFYYGSGGGVPMTKTKQNVWTTKYKAQANTTLSYKYNRNNYGYATDERFALDAEETRRTKEINQSSVTIQDEVKEWRWLSANPPKAELSNFRPEILPDRSQPFIIGITLLDFFQSRFEDFIDSTLDRIKEKGFKYIGIAVAAAFIINTDPLTFTEKPINTFSEEQLRSILSKAKERDLKIILFSGVETDPTGLEKSFEEIEESLERTHTDEWYRQFARKWQEVQVKTAKVAEEYSLEMFVPSNQWPFWGDKTDEQKRLLNPLINEAYEAIGKVYSGKISSDFYEESEFFDYYRQMDYIGDKWAWSLADKKDPTLEELKEAAQKKIDEYYKPISNKYNNKPIFFSQLSYDAYDGATGAVQIPNSEGPEIAEWYPENPLYPADFQENADVYEAVFEAIAGEPIFSGALAFGYSYWDSYDKSSGIRSKPAEDVWQKWADIFK